MTALAGIGLYSPKQAERLIGVDAEKIRRWIVRDRSPAGPLWHPEPESLGAEDTLSFKDLLEVRAVSRFREHGVSMHVIREALSSLSDYLQRDYPLIHPRLMTDGKDVFLQALEENGEEGLTDLVKRQGVLTEVIGPSLISGITFDASDNPVRWTPDPADPQIVIDPRFAFGKPIVLPSHVSTAALFDAFQAEEGDADTVARNFDITLDEVNRAVNFEKRIAAGALLH
ncbi:hypothetical protein L861_09680 [Litchfieldella anticariensis FP35 = DSM 16096]|uniref:DUF433 domain-containing protein n=1 Tax=Litchfieldella anticariensis (strain DSM 16096 / CECT 5854 / CIP 108499 / LMG 22089 / FP35) TaxID=1121939 RepID=S2KQ52_LITA3|nr:helix-turn-helix domain-containing protein [Halomonas anticariensis]EPC02603.1 hypothetical protein L861_09680 [Halomonas anticariensis FP35 = DSM 16096]